MIVQLLLIAFPEDFKVLKDAISNYMFEPAFKILKNAGEQ